MTNRSPTPHFSLLPRRRYGTKGTDSPWDGADGCRQADARSGGPCYACRVLRTFSAAFSNDSYCQPVARLNLTAVFQNVLPPHCDGAGSDSRFAGTRHSWRTDRVAEFDERHGDASARASITPLTTNVEGIFRLRDVRLGVYEVKITREGFETQTFPACK